MSKSTRRRKPRHHQSAKPHPDYPAHPAHPSGRWCKKIKGRLHYFGPPTIRRPRSKNGCVKGRVACRAHSP